MSSYITILLLFYVFLLRLKKVISDSIDADVIILLSERIQYSVLETILGDSSTGLVEAVVCSIRKVSLHSNNSCICNYA